MLEALKYRISELLLKNRLKKQSRSARIINQESAKYVGLIYVLDNKTTYDKIASFVKELQKQGKKVKAIGLVQHREDTQSFLPKLSFDFIYREDLNWFGIPKGHYTQDFLKEDFDILMDLGHNGFFALEFLFALSSAKMKVGHREYESGRHYDLKIQWEKNKDLSTYISEVQHYLNLLRSNTGAQTAK